MRFAERSLVKLLSVMFTTDMERSRDGFLQVVIPESSLLATGPAFGELYVALISLPWLTFLGELFLLYCAICGRLIQPGKV